MSLQIEGFETRPLHPRFGVEVAGLDLNDVEEGHLWPDLRAAFEVHSALLFRDQAMTEETHLRLARLFGPVEDRYADERDPGQAMAIPEVSNVAGAGGTYAEDDLKTLNLQANFLWHSDSTFLPTPALVNILTARVVPDAGGETELASTRAAFADLPPARQARLRGMRLRHRYAHSRARISPELAALPMFNKWPDTVWPAVWKNPVTGQEAIYIASHAFAVVGLSEAEGAAEIDALIGTATAPQYVYSHRWRPGDVLIWDQRAVLHRGRPWDFSQPRTLASLCASATPADGLTEMRAGAAQVPA